MRVFKEQQRFKEWWIIILAILTVIGLIFICSKEYEKNGRVGLGFFTLIFTIIIFAGLFLLRLKTKINADGIYAEFEPLPIFKKHFKWKEISQCYVRKYSPLNEYGGWGIRGFGKSKAYNVSGNIGIQIITKSNKKFLIGTKKPDEARKVIQRYHHKITKNE